MDVLEQKYLSRDLNFLYKVFQLGNNPIRLVGTGSMASQYYPADFDMLCQVKEKYTPEKLTKDFQKIVSQIDNTNKLFFIEFKLQQLAKGKKKEQEKHKVFDTKDLNLEFFSAFFNPNTELCKIDAIIWYDGKFKEVSCIYFFSTKPLIMADYIKALLEDGKQYYDDGKIYKSLKRLMLSAKYENPPDKNLIIAITRFFNSMVGKLYEMDNIIQASLIYMKKYGADERIKLFIQNIGLGHMNPDKLEDLSKDYQKIINGEAKKFYELYNLTPGKLPEYNSIKPIVN
jgi:hypothetical protein